MSRWSSQTQNNSFWTCRLCKGWTGAAKQKCYTCAANRKYAEMKPEEAHSCSDPMAQNRVPLSNSTANAAHYASQPHWSHKIVDDTMTPEQLQARNQMVEKLKKLEASMNCLPTEMTDMRTAITAEIESTKKDIMHLKPISTQIEGCKAALERANLRHQKWLGSMREAKENLRFAEEQVEKKTRELAELTQEQSRSSNSTLNDPNSLQSSRRSCKT